MLHVRHHAPIAVAEDGDVLVCASVGAAGEVIVVWSAAENRPILTTPAAQGAGIVPDPRAPRTAPARVTVHAPDIVSVVRITRPGLANLTAQPLPGGNILLVGTGSHWHPEGADRNAVIYDAAGRVLAEEALGDGIQHALADSTGHVWVGYSDEGIYGNDTWEYLGRVIRGSGLIRFAPTSRLPGATPR